MRRTTRQSSRLMRSTLVPEILTQAQEEPENDVLDIGDEESGRTTRKKRKTKHEVERPNALDASTLNQAPAAVEKKQEPSLFRNVRGRRGFLQYMNDMPLDIVHEIFGELEPIDLLHLSWSCKSVRAIVMGRQAKFLWSKAYKSLEHQPPPCPFDLNYTQYTRFLFVNRCMLCQVAISSNAIYCSWGLRLKVCKKCIGSDHFLHDGLVSVEARQCSHSILTNHRCRYYLRSVGRYDTCRLVNDAQARASLMEEFNRKQQGATRYEQWRDGEFWSRKEYLSQRQETRQLVILEKLQEIGWPKENIFKYLRYTTTLKLRNLPTIKRSSKLTRGEWTKLCPQILSILEEGKSNWKRERIRRNGTLFVSTFKQWYRNIRSETSGVRFQVVPYDFMVQEPFLSSILNCNEEPAFPLDTGMVSLFGVMYMECLQKRNEVLFNLLPGDMKQQAKELDEPYQILHLASIWFHDTSRSVLLDYPTALDAIRTPHQFNDTHKFLKELGESELFDPRIRVYRCEGNSDVSFNQKAHDLTKYFIQASGNDLNTTTRRVMNRSSVGVSCTRCSSEDYTWSNAIRHTIMFHDNVEPEESPSWEDMFCFRT